MGKGSEVQGKFMRLYSSIAKTSTSNEYKLSVRVTTSSTFVNNGYGVRIYAHVGSTKTHIGTAYIYEGVTYDKTFEYIFTVSSSVSVYASCICSECEDGKHTEFKDNFINQTSADTATYLAAPTKAVARITSATKTAVVSETYHGLTGDTYAGNNTLNFYIGRPGSATSMSLYLQYRTGTGSWTNYPGFPQSTTEVTINKEVTFNDSDRYGSAGKQWRTYATSTNATGTTTGDSVYFRFNDIPTILSTGLAVNSKRVSATINLTLPEVTNIIGGSSAFDVTINNTSKATNYTFYNLYSGVNTLDLSTAGVSEGDKFNITVYPKDSLESGIGYSPDSIRNIVRNSAPYFTAGTTIKYENVSNSVFYNNVRISFTSATDKEGDTITYSIYRRVKGVSESTYGSWTLVTSGVGRDYIIDASKFTAQGASCQFGVIASDGMLSSGTSPSITSAAITRIVPPPAPTNIVFDPSRTRNNYESINKVSWTAPKGGDGATITNYEVVMEVSSTSSFTSITSSTFNVTTNSIVPNISGITRGYYIRFKIRSKDAYGVFSETSTTSSYIVKNRKPNNVANLKAITDSRIVYETINLTWDKGTDSDNDNLTYEISRTINSGSKTVVADGLSSLTYSDNISTLAAASKVIYFIRAKDEWGVFSDYSQLTGAYTSLTVNTKPGDPSVILPVSKVHSKTPRLIFKAGTDIDGDNLTAIITIKGNIYNSAVHSCFDKTSYKSEDYIVVTPPIDLIEGINKVKIKLKDSYQESNEKEFEFYYEASALDAISNSQTLISKSLFDDLSKMINTTRAAYQLAPKPVKDVIGRVTFIDNTSFENLKNYILEVNQKINGYSGKPTAKRIDSAIKHNPISRSMYNSILDVILNV